MLQVEYKLKLGQDEFVLRADVKNEIEFFQTMSFYSNLPRVGPNGETDLKITHRTTKDGYNYYSIVSQQAGKEFKFGQINDKDAGLFNKGWEDLYVASNDGTAQTVGVGIQAQPVQQAPIQSQQPVVPQQVRTQTAGITVPAQPQVFPGVVTQSQTTAPVQPANPQITQAATDVLKRFGIQPSAR